MEKIKISDLNDPFKMMPPHIMEDILDKIESSNNMLVYDWLKSMFINSQRMCFWNEKDRARTFYKLKPLTRKEIKRRKYRYE